MLCSAFALKIFSEYITPVTLTVHIKIVMKIPWRVSSFSAFATSIEGEARMAPNMSISNAIHYISFYLRPMKIRYKIPATIIRRFPKTWKRPGLMYIKLLNASVFDKAQQAEGIIKCNVVVRSIFVIACWTEFLVSMEYCTNNIMTHIFNFTISESISRLETSKSYLPESFFAAAIAKGW